MTPPRTDLPTGTVTFLRTDVEGSMRLARALGAAWDALNETQLSIVRRSIAEEDGIAVRTEGDAVFAVFRDAGRALRAAIAIQRALASHPWPDDAAVRVRIGLHSGEAHLAGDDYGGFDVNRAARIAAVGHGGQVVLSDATRALVAGDLEADVTIRDLGRHILRDVPLPEQLFQLETEGLQRAFPPLRTAGSERGNVPPRLTSFVARDTELGELRELIERARLVTITGPGGIGKTSLALELARSLADRYPDGTWLVALDELRDPALVAATIARTFGIYDGPGRPVTEGLARFLAERTLLLVLDNFEQVIEAAPVVAELLRAAPGLRVVVTSRAPLHVGGEHEYAVRALKGVADDGPSPAASLFIDRARAALPGWDAAGDLPIVEEICRLVDGLPLGIELAAARMSLLPPAAIRQRLEARLPLPGATQRDVPTRQRTLEGAIAWSVELLPEARQRLIRELSVFDGGFDVEQAVIVATDDRNADLLDALLELADQSLLGRAAMTGHSSGTGSIRFRMLDTIRSFAARQLIERGEEPSVRRRHASAMLELAEAAAGHMTTATQAGWLDRLALDHANLRSALGWAIEAGAVELAQRLAYSTWRYWQLGGHLREGRALADGVVAMPGADEPSPGRMWSFAAAGGLAYWQADAPRAQELYERQLETALQIGDQAGEADARFNLAATEFIRGDPARSIQLLERAELLYSSVGDDRGLGRLRWSRANLAMLSGRAEEAVDDLIDAKTAYEAAGDAMYAQLAAGSIGFGYHILGRRKEALRAGAEALALSYAIRDVATTTISLAGAAIMLLEAGLVAEAATMMGAFDGLCELHGVGAPAGIGRLIAEGRVEERVFAALSSEEHADAVARGRAMSLEEAVRYANDVVERVTAPGDS